MKILIAGNPRYGLAGELKEKYPGATFASRSNGGWDLSNIEKRHEFAEISIEYDVVISVSCLWNFGQVLLIKDVISKWIEKNHNGYLIAIGSSADTPVKGTEWLYPVEKKSLRSYCRQLSQMSAGNNQHRFKITYLSPGNLHTPMQDKKLPDVPKIECRYMCDVIDWLLCQPTSVNISELCLDRIP